MKRERLLGPYGDPLDVTRLDGLWPCPVCGTDARDHAQDPDNPWPTFVLLCDGRRGKV